MTRYAIGDIHGCLPALQAVLKTVNFNPSCDQLWCVGDLVNRGPASLATLHFIKSLGDCTRIVLGNHDLHFLAVAHDAQHIKEKDTFFDLLASDHREALITWLCQQSLLYTDPSGDYSMVHAGIPPQWSLAQAHGYAREVEAVLRGDQMQTFLQHMYGRQPDCWDDHLQSWDRLRTISNYLTRMRFCTAQGKMDFDNKSQHHDDPTMAPWFAHPQRKTRHDKLVFGHWSTLRGRVAVDNIDALDTGCVWGDTLTLLNLETRERHEHPCCERSV